MHYADSENVTFYWATLTTLQLLIPRLIVGYYPLFNNLKGILVRGRCQGFPERYRPGRLAAVPRGYHT